MAGWTNEIGEPIMDGDAYRFEQALDSHLEMDYEDRYGDPADHDQDFDFDFEDDEDFDDEIG